MVEFEVFLYWSRKFAVLCEGDPWPALNANLKVYRSVVLLVRCYGVLMVRCSGIVLDAIVPCELGKF